MGLLVREKRALCPHMWVKFWPRKPGQLASCASLLVQAARSSPRASRSCSGLGTRTHPGWILSQAKKKQRLCFGTSVLHILGSTPCYHSPEHNLVSEKTAELGQVSRGQRPETGEWVPSGHPCEHNCLSMSPLILTPRFFTCRLSSAGIKPSSFLAWPQALGAPLSHPRDAVSLRFPST